MLLFYVYIWYIPYVMVNKFYWCPQCERCKQTGFSGMCNMCYYILTSEICIKCDRYKLLKKHYLCDMCSIISNIYTSVHGVYLKKVYTLMGNANYVILLNNTIEIRTLDQKHKK